MTELQLARSGGLTAGARRGLEKDEREDESSGDAVHAESAVQVSRTSMAAVRPEAAGGTPERRSPISTPASARTSTSPIA